MSVAFHRPEMLFGETYTFSLRGDAIMTRTLEKVYQLIRQVAYLVMLPLVIAQAASAQDPLPSWRDSDVKRTIVQFVERVTLPGTVDFVPEEQRIAVFDNDGTLWSEQPMYVQMAFALDRVKSLGKERPELLEKPLFQAIATGNREYLSKVGERDVVELVIETHAKMSTEEFEKIAKEWIATAKHPVYQRPYTECVYVPMLEMLGYLSSKQFKTFIVSGGGIDFMRPWVESVYGIPPEQVIGSSVKMQYELRDSIPTLMRLPEIDFIDDKSGKPVGIQRHIGRRPILAVGNSDGDYEMLQYVTSGKGPSLGVFIHHTDANREVAYDRRSIFGRLDRGLDDASQNGWHIVDMQRDWERVFIFQQ